jgi:hypothetical protein
MARRPFELDSQASARPEAHLCIFADCLTNFLYFCTIQGIVVR